MFFSSAERHSVWILIYLPFPAQEKSGSCSISNLSEKRRLTNQPSTIGHMAKHNGTMRTSCYILGDKYAERAMRETFAHFRSVFLAGKELWRDVGDEIPKDLMSLPTMLYNLACLRRRVNLLRSTSIACSSYEQVAHKKHTWIEFHLIYIHRHGWVRRFNGVIGRGKTRRELLYGKKNIWFYRLHYCGFSHVNDILNNFIVYSIFLLVHKQIKVLKDQISELSMTNYDLEKEVRLLDQHIGFLVAYKKAIEVQLGVSKFCFRRFLSSVWVISRLFFQESSENFLELERKYGKTIFCSLSCRH